MYSCGVAVVLAIFWGRVRQWLLRLQRTVRWLKTAGHFDLLTILRIFWHRQIVIRSIRICVAAEIIFELSVETQSRSDVNLVAHATSRWQTAVSFASRLCDFVKHPVNRTKQFSHSIEVAGDS